jgi:hypothetical protein
MPPMSSPRLDARVYAKRLTGVDRADAMALSQRLEDRLRSWYADGRLAGFRVRVAFDADDVEYHALDPDVYEEFLDGGPPFIAVNLTYDLDSPRRPDESEMAAVAREFGLELLA